MRRLSAVFVACAALLSGCLGGDVSRVKESRMKGWPDFTVGQLLDKRQACANTEWKSFTDTRDRRVVEYNCDNQVAVDFLKRLNEEEVEHRRRMQQMVLKQAKDRLVNAEQDIITTQAEYEKQRDRVAKFQGPGTDESEAVRADFALIQKVREDSCAQTDTSQFMVGVVAEIAEKMVRQCKEAVQMAERCPDAWQQSQRVKWLLCQTQSRLYTGTPRSAIATAVQQVREMVEKFGRDQDRQLRTAQEQLSAAERAIQSANERLATARMEAEAAPNNQHIHEQEAFVEQLNRKWGSFKMVRETSQWAIQDGQPVYLGSKVDLVFTDRSVNMPMELEHVFSQAADNVTTPTKINPFYLTQLQRMWESYGVPKH